MRRRSLLSTLGGLVLGGLGGCLGGSPGASEPATGSPTATETTASTSSAGPTDATRTATPLGVETPAPGECTAVEPPKPSPPDRLPPAWSYPDRPEEFTLDSVRRFAEGYETTYRYNRLLADLATGENCVKNLDVYLADSSASRADDTFVATATTGGSYTGTHCETVTGTDTPTPLPHADLARRPARYVVTERFAMREGTVVECW